MEKTFKYLNAETLNALYAEGYRFYVQGDFKHVEEYDPRCGMRYLTFDCTYHAFDDRDNAVDYAQTQTDPETGFWPMVPRIPAHSETLEEYSAKKAAENRAKRYAADEKKAREAGMTVEEYRKARARKAAITRTKNEIAALEKELGKKRKYLKKLDK